MIDPAKIEEVKNSTDIVEVISDYLLLKKSGKNYKALCPFHNEKTPSFIVSPEKQIFHCFGCGIGGNVFTFIQKQENLSFVESVLFLAKKAGIEIKDSTNYKITNEKEQIIEVNKEALKFFCESFNKSEKAKNYAKIRELSEEVINDFKIGYAPQGSKLYTYLKSKGFSDDIIIKAGLCQKKGNDMVDIFFDRLIFPIFNIYDAPIAFGARVFDNSLPKYINTKETPAYIKGKTIFNLNNAKKFCSEEIIVVEGYMDTVAIYKSGIKNVVATSGTALTEEQARLIKRYTKKVVLIYDSDEPGKNGALRGGNNLFAEGLEVFVVLLNEAKDPDEFIKKFGKDEFKKKIENAIPFIDFRINMLKERGKIDNPYYKTKVLNELVDFIGLTDNLILKEEIIKKVNLELDIPENIIKGYIKNNKRSNEEKIEKLNNKISCSKGTEIAEKFLFEIIFSSLNTDDETILLKYFIERRRFYKIEYDDFKNRFFSEVLQNIEEFFSGGEKEILKKIQAKYIESDEANKNFSEILAKENLSFEINTKFEIINDCFLKIINEKLKKQSMELQTKIKDAEIKKDIKNLNEYIKEKIEIQKKIKDLTGGRKID